MEAASSEYLLSLVMAICKSVLRRELSTDEGYIQATINHALELLSEEQGIVNLTLHPDDATSVSDNWSDELGELTITSDPEITRGGCLIQRNDSLVDATIESQLRKIIADLSFIPGPITPSGETTDLLDAKQVDLTSERLVQSVDLNE